MLVQSIQTPLQYRNAQPCHVREPPPALRHRRVTSPQVSVLQGEPQVGEGLVGGAADAASDAAEGVVAVEAVAVGDHPVEGVESVGGGGAVLEIGRASCREGGGRGGGRE